MTDDQYIYAVARIRSKELTLLDKSVLDQLMSCKSYEDCMRTLTDRGWGNPDDVTTEEMLSSEREKTWELMRELVDDMSVFNTFLYEKDFHNLKAAIKQVYMNKEFPNIYLQEGMIAPTLILESVKQHDFTMLPEIMQKSAEAAYQEQMHSGDGQMCDVILDKATLETIYKKSKESGNELFSAYAELRVVTANINIAIRGAKTHKKRAFFEQALAECETLDIQLLLEASLNGVEAIYEYLLTTVYETAVVAIKESPSAFEKWCDNLIIEYIKPQKYNSFTISPLAAYILARENEIKTVRILLSGKLNELSETMIRERLRDMYV